MAKDTKVNTESETVETHVEKATFGTHVRTFWDTNKNKLFWFGIGTVAGATTVISTALLVEPHEEQYEGDNEPTVAIDTSSLENTES